MSWESHMEEQGFIRGLNGGHRDGCRYKAKPVKDRTSADLDGRCLRCHDLGVSLRVDSTLDPKLHGGGRTSYGGSGRG